MKAFRFVLFSILLPIICAFFFALDGFCANAPLAGLAPSTLSWNDISSNHNVLAHEPNSYYEYYLMTRSNDSIEAYIFHDGYRLYWVSPNYITSGEVQYFYASSRNNRIQGTSLPNSIWSFVDVNGKTMYYTYFDIYSNRIDLEFIGIPQLNLSEFNYNGSIEIPKPNPLHRLPNDNPLRFHVNTLKDFKYSLIDTQPWDDLISRWLSDHNLLSADFIEYTSGIYHFTWGNTIDMHIDGQSIVNDVPLSAVQVQYGYMNLYTGAIVKQLTWKTYDDGFFNSYQPDFAGIQSFIYTLLDDFANHHPVILFTPVVDYEGSKYFGETLVFDMALKKIGSDSPWFNNDTSVTGSDGKTYNVDFGTGSSSSYSYQGGEWDSNTDIDLGDVFTNYNNYITNNHGLSVDEILYILTHDPRFQSGPTEIIITPQFDPNGISDNDDLWLGKLRSLYQMILGFNPLIDRIVAAFSSFLVFLPDWVLNFMFTVGSVGLLLGIVKVIRG